MLGTIPKQCFFSFQGRKVTLKPLSPQEVHEDQIKMKIKRENEKENEVHDKTSHNTLSTKSILLTLATPTRYSSTLSFSFSKIPTSTPYWIKSAKDDFFKPPIFPNNIIPKQTFPTWSVYRTSFFELPTIQSAKSSLPISSCILLSNCKLTLFYAGVLNLWTNSLQLGGYDENQKDIINRRKGQGPKHLKFFLLVFSKDEVQVEEVQAQEGQAEEAQAQP